MTAPSMYSSPKRKRSELDLGLGTLKAVQDQYSPALTPAADDQTKFHAYPFPEPTPYDRNGSGSPRSVVAGQLGELDIRGDFVRRLDFGGVANKRARLRDDWKDDHDVTEAPSCQEDRDDVPAVSEAAQNPSGQGDSVAEKEESSRKEPRTDSPSPSSAKLGSESPTDPSEPNTPTITSPAKPNSKVKATPRTRKKSPPLPSQDEDPLTWHDSEITGHIAADEDDDGYGINGIGFRPTAAVAYQRSLKRKQQVREWQRREQGEERKRRGERRKGGAGEAGGDPGQASGILERRDSKGKGVRFKVEGAVEEAT
jgi:hypothetical protein